MNEKVKQIQTLLKKLIEVPFFTVFVKLFPSEKYFSIGFVRYIYIK